MKERYIAPLADVTNFDEDIYMEEGGDGDGTSPEPGGTWPLPGQGGSGDDPHGYDPELGIFDEYNNINDNWAKW